MFRRSATSASTSSSSSSWVTDVISGVVSGVASVLQRRRRGNKAPERHASDSMLHVQRPVMESPVDASLDAVPAFELEHGCTAVNYANAHPLMLPKGRSKIWSCRDYYWMQKIYDRGHTAVYQAVCGYSHQIVAIKVIDLRRVPEHVKRDVKREVNIHASINHDCIVQLYGAFQDGHLVCLVQEFAAMTLTQQMYMHRKVWPVAGDRTVLIQYATIVLRALLEAVAYLHARRVCHRDIKPDNVFVMADGRIVLGDMGLALDLSQELPTTQAGTVGYIAPEVCGRGWRKPGRSSVGICGAPANIWAVGVVAYELILGFRPAVWPTRALAFPASVPLSVRYFIEIALDDDPVVRPTASEMLTILDFV